MHLFYEIFPVLAFFIAFKLYDIYVATSVGIVATLLQVIINRWWYKKWDRKQLITLAVFTLFGGLTLYFHNPIFVKWKPTIVFWIFAVIILLSQWITSKPVTQRLMEHILQGKGEVPKQVWLKLNLIWAFFFAALGGLNLYIAYSFNNDTWVNFKFYGITIAFFILSIVQAVYLMQYVKEVKTEK